MKKKFVCVLCQTYLFPARHNSLRSSHSGWELIPFVDTPWNKKNKIVKSSRLIHDWWLFPFCRENFFMREYISSKYKRTSNLLSLNPKLIWCRWVSYGLYICAYLFAIINYEKVCAFFNRLKNMEPPNINKIKTERLDNACDFQSFIFIYHI